MKNNREGEYKLFIEKILHLSASDYQIKSLPVDCSFRSYHKILHGEKSYILMDSPPECEDISPFVTVTKILLDFGFSAPQIYALDKKNGLAIIEDFGDNLIKNILIAHPNLSTEIYEKIINTLISIQKRSHNNSNMYLEEYDEEKLMSEVLLFVEWYYPALFGFGLSDKGKENFIRIWKSLFKKIYYKKDTLVLRDYHVENLMLLPGRKPSQEIGLLDYQDAVLGSYAYDLVSLLEDARIEVRRPFREKMITYYISNSENISYKEFLSDYAILGLQRNCKIIGIFTRKSIRDKNSHYLQYLPRVWSYINDSINHPVLYEMKKWMIEEKIPFIRVD